MPKRIACSARYADNGRVVEHFPSMEAGAEWAGCHIQPTTAVCPHCSVELHLYNFAMRMGANGLIRNAYCRHCDIIRQRLQWRECQECGKKHRAKAEKCFRCRGKE